VGVVKENQASGENAGRETIARLPHDEVNNRNGQSTENRGQRPEGDIWNLVGDVRIADVLEMEVTVISNQPSHKGEEELAEWGMDVEEVRPLEVIRGELKTAIVSRG
jgi:hypothetical protein